MKSSNYTWLSLFAVGSSLLLTACTLSRPPEQSEGHLSKADIVPAAEIPAPVTQTTLLPEPELRPRLETYTVIVSDVPAKDLLFSMARDAKLNLDIHSDITGNVTLNAIDQTLPQILERLSQQVSMRYSIEDSTLRVRADTPYLRNYKIDYVNISREARGEIRVASSLGSTGQSDIGQSSGGSGSRSGGSGRRGDNSSLTEVSNQSENKFWQTLTLNIKSFLVENGSDIEAINDDRVIVNKETGLIAVKATQKQHALIQRFVDQVLVNAKRQVLIEATIAEIKLSDRYQAGIDWSLIASDPLSGVGFNSNFRGGNLSSSPVSTLTISDIVSGDQLSMTLSALEQFGDVQVLSSPKVMAINNQPAILKVVDNIVFFEIEVDTTTNQTITSTTYETTINSVPVGFVMSVTPYISEDNVVTLNIRPTISRVIETVNDPNPVFADAGVVSEVPVIQVREIESILQVNSGDTAIIGGLMQDTKDDVTRGVPLLMDIPFVGKLFSYTDELQEKSELVIFIKPIVVDQASLASDLNEYQKYLPKESMRNKKQAVDKQ